MILNRKNAETPSETSEGKHRWGFISTEYSSTPYRPCVRAFHSLKKIKMSMDVFALVGKNKSDWQLYNCNSTADH
jgi:hypothetical protein